MKNKGNVGHIERVITPRPPIEELMSVEYPTPDVERPVGARRSSYQCKCKCRCGEYLMHVRSAQTRGEVPEGE